MTYIWHRRKCILSRPLKTRSHEHAKSGFFELLEVWQHRLIGKLHIVPVFGILSHFQAVSERKIELFETMTSITHFPDFLIDGFYNLYNTDFQTTKETHRVHKASICTISFMKRLHFEWMIFTFDLDESLQLVTEVNLTWIWHTT